MNNPRLFAAIEQKQGMKRKKRNTDRYQEK